MHKLPGFNYLAVSGIFFIVVFIYFQYTNISKGNMHPHEPTKDFSFIKRYMCISDLLGVDQWRNNKGMSFSEDGIYLSNGKMHPVNICHYALFCYDEYNMTNKQEFKDAFLLHARALLDSNFYHRIDETKIAWPYLFNFHDLKSPWYSALAQAEAISVLIRYYAMSGDRRAIPAIVQAMNFMLAPQDDPCGTMSITPEGHEWYEEYPNSAREKQVLNGFFVVMIALYEYSKFFPNDVVTPILLKNSIATVKDSFKFYDSGNWLRYNRGDKRLVANGYMKWQVLELKFLHQLTGDKYFKHLAMLVSSYCFNKPYDTPGSKMRDYDFAVPLALQNDGTLIYEGKYSSYDLKYLNAKVSSTYNLKSSEHNKLYDSNMSSFTTLVQSPSDNIEEKYISISIEEDQLIGSFRIIYAGSDTIKKPSLKITYLDSFTETVFKPVLVKNIVKDSKTVTYNISTINAKSYQFEFNHSGGFDSIKVAEIILTKPLDLTEGDFRFYTSPEYMCSGGEVTLNFDYKGMRDIAVFYKVAATQKLLEKELWNSNDVKQKLPVKIKTKPGSYVKFLIIGEPSGKNSTIKNVKVTG